MSRLLGLLAAVLFAGVVGNIDAEETFMKWDQPSVAPSTINLSPSASTFSVAGQPALGSLNLNIGPSSSSPSPIPAGIVSQSSSPTSALYDPLASFTSGSRPTPSLKPTAGTKLTRRSTTPGAPVGLLNSSTVMLPGGIGASSLLQSSASGAGSRSIYMQPTPVAGMIPGVNTR